MGWVPVDPQSELILKLNLNPQSESVPCPPSRSRSIGPGPGPNPGAPSRSVSGVLGLDVGSCRGDFFINKNIGFWVGKILVFINKKVGFWGEKILVFIYKIIIKIGRILILILKIYCSLDNKWKFGNKGKIVK